jgi:hypothetical protein
MGNRATICGATNQYAVRVHFLHFLDIYSMMYSGPLMRASPPAVFDQLQMREMSMLSKAATCKQSRISGKHITQSSFRWDSGLWTSVLTDDNSGKHMTVDMCTSACRARNQPVAVLTKTNFSSNGTPDYRTVRIPLVYNSCDFILMPFFLNLDVRYASDHTINLLKKTDFAYRMWRPAAILQETRPG